MTASMLGMRSVAPFLPLAVWLGRVSVQFLAG